MKALMASQEKADIAGSDSDDSEKDELVGRCLNETYLIEGVLGEGGVGRVYRARHVRIRTKRYALKVLHAEHARDPHQLARFQQEAEAAASLSHPNVVGVFDVGRTEDGYSYLACELLNGTDLDAYLEQRGKLDVTTAILVGLQICDALSTAHSQNIVHRDLKPQNVFLLNGPDGELPVRPIVKLLDFGLSRFLDHADTQLTKTGTVMGTPAFMAPEQATGNRGDHRVDVYGIGVILYAALTGQPPFMEETLPAMLVAVMTEQAPRPTKLAPDIPEALELLIQRSMAKDPDERYQSVDDVRAALQAILDATDSTSREMMAFGRPRMGSILHAEENYDLRTSRPRLVLYGILGICLAITFLTSAVSGLEVLTGPFEFGVTELILVLMGICGTIVTPAFIAFRHFKKTIWSNSAKVIDVLARLRNPLIAGLIAYGAASIGIRFLDDFVSRLAPNPLLSRDPGIGWPGFTWLLPGIALLVGGASYCKRRFSEGPEGMKRRVWLGAPLSTLTITLSVTLLFLGLKWRSLDLAAQAEEQARVEKAKVTAEPAPPEAPSAPAAPLPPEPIKLATDTELVKAIEMGVDGLLPLSEKYPKDARVLEPLLLAFASRATGLADAMVTAKRLIDVAPENRDSESLGLIVKRAAATPGNASDLAFALMKDDLGQAGPDLLYQLKKSGNKASDRAGTLLLDPEIQPKVSPALRIALELEAATSCEARLALLGRATHLGDMRSVGILAPLGQGTKTGCGKWKNRPCPAQCKDQSKEYLDAIKAIQARAANTGL